MRTEFEHNRHHISRDFEAVGGYISAAMQEIALDLGGEELADKVSLMSHSESILPNPEALRLLEEIEAGSAERVIFRSGEIQTEAHQRELAEANRIGLLKIGGAIIKGFASFNIFGNPPRKNH